MGRMAAADLRALIQMATGAGKTYTACSFTYRLIKYAGAKRVLFLVDRSNLGRQALAEFQQFVAPDTGRKFTEVYNVQHLTSSNLDSVARVTICTIQRLYSLLRGEELEEDLDEKSGYEIASALESGSGVAPLNRGRGQSRDGSATLNREGGQRRDASATLYQDKLLLGVALGKRDEDTLTTLAGRFAQLDREISRDEAKKLATLAGGQTLGELSGKPLRAIDADNVAAASRRLLQDRVNDPAAPDEFGPPPIGYFDPEAPVAHLSGDLPHWRQAGVTYFVTFRLVDSLPQEKLDQWRTEMADWLQSHPEPHDEATRQEFYNRFPARLQRWLDAGSGSCVLDIAAVHTLVENALRHFDKDRYSLDEFVVARNHVHALVTPLAEPGLSDILHSWKSFTAHEILKVEAAYRRLSAVQGIAVPVSYCSSQGGSDVPPLKGNKGQRRDASATSATSAVKVWQKESFDHIVRSPASLDKFRAYIRAHRPDSESGLFLSEDLRRDAAATLADEACAPFDIPALRDALAKAKQDVEQTIDTVTVDTVLSRGFDAAAKAKAAGLVAAFRDYLKAHQTEIDALQILYSRPFKQRLTEPMLKELEQKLRESHAGWTEDRLWDAHAVTAPGKVQGRSQAGRFADLVSLVRFSLEQQPVLKPFAESVTERFNEWLMDQAKAGLTFNAEQIAWLNLIREHIATSLSIEPDDLELSPFNQRGGLGKAHQLFGKDLPRILDELNLKLVA